MRFTNKCLWGNANILGEWGIMKHLVIVGFAAFGLTGCLATDGGTYAPNTAAKPAVLMPAPAPVFGSSGNKKITEKTTSKTKSWMSADGTKHTKTTSSSASMSVDKAALGNALFALLGATPPAAAAPAATNANQTSAYVGKWRIESNGKQCDLTLRDINFGTTGYASVFGCLGNDMSSATKWALRGYDIVLTGIMDKPVATLRATQPNRMDGTTQAGASVVAWR